MSHPSAACPASFTALAPRSPAWPAAPFLLSRRVLAVAAGGLLMAALAILPQRALRVAADEAPGLVHVVQAADPVALRDAAEAMRARLLAVPGVGAVSIEGLRQQRLVVDYAPRRLAGLGITAAQLAAALPVDAAQSGPGALALRVADAPEGLQTVADLPVRSGGRVFRLGDVALVARAPLEPPVSVLRVDGRPAARLVVTGVK